MCYRIGSQNFLFEDVEQEHELPPVLSCASISTWAFMSADILVKLYQASLTLLASARLVHPAWCMHTAF